MRHTYFKSIYFKAQNIKTNVLTLDSSTLHFVAPVCSAPHDNISLECKVSNMVNSDYIDNRDETHGQTYQTW